MSVIVYRCDVCNREQEVSYNSAGLNIIQRCTITKNCRGKLHPIKYNENQQLPKRTKTVGELEDWTPRRIIYTHTQIIPDTVWKIVHNLHGFPRFSLLLDNTTGESVPSDVIFEDENTIIFKFLTAKTGTVQFLNRQTSTEEHLLTETTPTTIQVSTHSTLTIATLDAAQSFELNVSLNQQQYTLQFDNIPSINSPWVDSQQILAFNKTYVVRDVKLIDYLPSVAFTDITIENTLNPRDVLCLLAHEPYSIYDKNVDQYIDLSKQLSLSYNEGELYALSTDIDGIYPKIITI